MFYCTLSQSTPNFIEKLINLHYCFKTPFKIFLKDIIMGKFSHTNDGVKLEILPKFIEAFLRHLSFCRRKAFQEDGNDKIHTIKKISSLALISLRNFEIHKRLQNCKFCVYEFLNFFEFLYGNI